MQAHRRPPTGPGGRWLAAAAAALLLLAHPAPAPAQELPDTPAGRQAQAFLAAVRDADENGLRTFVRDHMADRFQRMPMESSLERFRILRERTAGEQVVGVQLRTPERITVVLKPRDGDPVRISMEVEPEPPHRIRGYRIESGEEGPALAFSSLDDLDRRLRAEAEAGRFSGVVLATDSGSPVFHRAYGLADRAAKLPVRPDTRFNIGSLDKNFTAVAVLQLAQEGRLALDDTLGKHLEGFPAGISGRVTLRQLLQHRSGMGDYLTHPSFAADPGRFREVAGLVALARTVPLEFEPGTRNRYSNFGYAVLGGVIEAVTGRPYHDVVRERVFAPAGMASTNAYGRRAGQENTALGYTRREGADSLVSNEATRPPRGSPAGGGYSTAEDLGRFVRALLDGKLLDQAHTQLFLDQYHPAGASPRAGSRLGMAGGAAGINAAWEADLETGRVVVVLANLDPPVAQDLAPAILRQLGGAAAPAPARGAAAAPPPTPRRLADTLAAVVERHYVTPDTARVIAARLRARAAAGAFDGLTAPAELAAALGEELRSVNGDKHLGVKYSAAGPQAGAKGPGAQQPPTGVLAVERLEGDVGYLKLGVLDNGFDAMAEALRKLDGSSAVILDLRGVPGGSAPMANFLVSHFVAPGVHTMNVHDPARGDTLRLRTLTEVPGPRRTEVPLYVLVDAKSGSAAEHVPFVLQNLKRATVVGERTSGAGRPNRIFPLGGGFSASVSVMRSREPGTGREWERVGVAPDLAVPSAEALEAARGHALRRNSAATRRTR